MTREQRAEQILRRLVAAPSVSGQEEEGVKACHELMQEIGLSTTLVACQDDPEATNVEGSYGTREPDALLGRPHRYRAIRGHVGQSVRRAAREPVLRAGDV